MKQGLNLPEMAAELQRQQATKRDFVADTRQMEFCVDEGGTDSVALQMAIGETETRSRFPLRKTAHAQFAAATKVPKPYYDRMLSEAPDLLVRNLNHWLEREPAKKLVRTLDGHIRALLSNRYRPLDNFDLAESILPKLTELEARVESSAITEDRFYLKAVTPRVTGTVKSGDIVQAGIVVSNSEVGQGSLRLEEMDYRLVCLNGMIRGVAVRKAHIGRGNGDDLIEGAREFYRDETRRLEDAAFWNKVTDSATAIFDTERFNRRLLQYQEAAEETIDCDPVRAIEEVQKRFELTDGERGSVLKHLVAGGDLSRWGVANAVTRASQDVEDYTRATDLEQIGGGVIELAREDWKKIASA